MKLYNRETSYYTIITIPKCLVSKYGKKQIWRSLNTKDYKLAKLRAELETMSMTPGKKIYRDAYFWVPLISLYSGARLNEICQLSLDDVRIKEGINIIHISNVEGKKVKTSAGHRDLPIHPVLLKLGFLGYVEQQRKDKNNKSKRLFPELKLNSRNEYSAGMSK